MINLLKFLFRKRKISKLTELEKQAHQIAWQNMNSFVDENSSEKDLKINYTAQYKKALLQIQSESLSNQ